MDESESRTHKPLRVHRGRVHRNVAHPLAEYDVVAELLRLNGTWNYSGYVRRLMREDADARGLDWPEKEKAS